MRWRFLNPEPAFIWGKSQIGAKFIILNFFDRQILFLKFEQTSKSCGRVLILMIDQINDAIFDSCSRFSENSQNKRQAKFLFTFKYIFFLPQNWNISDKFLVISRFCNLQKLRTISTKSLQVSFVVKIPPLVDVSIFENLKIPSLVAVKSEFVNVVSVTLYKNRRPRVATRTFKVPLILYLLMLITALFFKWVLSETKMQIWRRN